MSKIIDLKGSILSLTVLHVFSEDIEQTKQAIAAKIEQAPDFFDGVPVVIQPQIELQDPTYLALLVEYLHQLKMMPIGIRTEDEAIQNQAQYAGLAIFPLTHKKPKSPTDSESSGWQSAKVVKGAIRSGQQVYAKNRDLVVLGSINPGAEVIADGHVHVYGKIRGKVFAGSGGLEQAQIFAEAMDPELICIAGMYQLSEDIGDNHKNKPVEISLQDDKLIFESLRSNVF